MAYAIIKSNSVHNIELDDETISIPAYGVIHLWIEGTPPTPTNLFVLVGDFKLQDYPMLKSIKSFDLNTLTEKLTVHFAERNLSLADYGISKRRGFRSDIHVPAELVNGY